MAVRLATIWCFALTVGLLATCVSHRAFAQDQQTRIVNREQHLKAAFLFHFISFITWPAGTLDDESIEIGVLGEDRFGKALETIDGKIVGGRKIIVKRAREVEDLKSSDVLFIAGSEQARLGNIFSKLDERGVLTVSNIDDFASEWGVINFTTRGNRVGFEINTAAAKRSRLRVSSRLLRVAKVVDDAHRELASQ